MGRFREIGQQLQYENSYKSLSETVTFYMYIFILILAMTALMCSSSPTIEISEAKDGTWTVAMKSLFETVEHKFNPEEIKADIVIKDKYSYQNTTQVKRKPRIVISRGATNISLTKTYVLEDGSMDFIANQNP